MPHFIFILILILSIIAFILYPIEAEMNSVSFDLIHHDSKFSPFYNSSMTKSEVSSKAVMRSLNRLNHFNSFMSIDAKYVESMLTIGDYFISFAISDQTTTRYAIPNMVSDLIWVHSDQKKDSSFYNPKSSTTYDVISYDTEYCSALQHPEKGESNECQYENQHSIGGFSSSGVLSTETFYFKLPNGQHKQFSKIVFGCDDAHQNKLKGGVEGVVGLGQGLLSLVSQFGKGYKKFSYCLKEKSIQSRSTIKFGSDVKLNTHLGGEYNVKFTHNLQDPYYYLNLEDISINGEKIDLPSTEHFSMAVDIQTAHTSLPPYIYDKVIHMFKKQATGIITSVKVLNNGACFLKTDIEALEKVPRIVFHFKKAKPLAATEFHVNPNTLFMEYNQYKCLTIVSTKGIYVLGNKAQVNKQMLFDLSSHTLTFAGLQCASFI